MGGSAQPRHETSNQEVPNPLLLLIHSPLVGPSSWRPLEKTARDRGFDVRRPDLTSVAAARSPKWRHFVDLATQSAARTGKRLRSMIFVDAIVPPAEGTHATSQQFLAFLDDKVVEDTLPQWIDWWPPEVIDAMVPNQKDLNELRHDMPRLPRSFFDETVPVPQNWSTGPCAYLKLSAAYEREYTDVRQMGWKHSAIDGTHLSIFTDPAAVLNAIEGLVEQLDR